jgi:undecaprenyl-diphosphatase
LRRLHPGSPLISLVLLATFLGVAFLVSAGITQGWDRSFSLLVHRACPPGLVRFMSGATILGTRDFAAPVIMGVLGLLITRRHYGPALGFALLAVGGGGPAELVKLFVQRARPQLWHGAATAAGYSFPSGHATFITILTASLVALTWPGIRAPRGRALLVATALGVSLLVGLSRVVLGVHYLSDVLGGFLLGGFWVALYLGPLRSAWQPLAAGRLPRPLGWVLALGVFVAARWFSPSQFPSIPEELLDLLCLTLVAWGFFLRVRLHWRPAAVPRRPAAILGDGFVGTLLIGAGLSLMLRDLVVLASFALFFGLWWALCTLALSEEVGTPGEPARPASPGEDCPPRTWRACRVMGALRREADVLGLSLVGALLIEHREWTAAHPLHLRSDFWLILVLAAALAWLELRRPALARWAR